VVTNLEATKSLGDSKDCFSEDLSVE